MKALRKAPLLLAAGALFATSAQAQIDFTQFQISEILTVAEIEAALGKSNDTFRFNGVAVTEDPNEVILVHSDLLGQDTFASFDLTTKTANWSYSAAAIVADLEASAPGTGFTSLVLEAELVYRNGLVYFADSGLDVFPATPPFRFSVNILDVTDPGSISASVVKVGTDIEDWHTHGLLSDGTVVGTLSEAFTSGAPQIGYLDLTDPLNPVWVEVFDEDDLVATANAFFGVTTFGELPPEALAVDPRNDDVYVWAHDGNVLFRISGITGASPTLAVADIPAWNQTADFHGLTIDADGNIYGFDEAFPESLRVFDGAADFVLDLDEIAEAINGPTPPAFAVKTWRGVKARTVSATQAEVFLASGTADYGVVRILFGEAPTSVGNWHLFE